MSLSKPLFLSTMGKFSTCGWFVWCRCVGWAGNADLARPARPAERLEMPLELLSAWIHRLLFFHWWEELGSPWMPNTALRAVKSCRGGRRNSQRPRGRKKPPHAPVGRESGPKAWRRSCWELPNSCPPQQQSRRWHRVPLRQRELRGKVLILLLFWRSTVSTHP